MSYKLGKVGISRLATIFPAFSSQANHLGAVLAGNLTGFGTTFDGKACYGASFDTVSNGAKDDVTGLVHTRMIGEPLFLMTSANGAALAASSIIERSDSPELGSLNLKMEGEDGVAAIAGFCQEDASGNAVDWISPNESFILQVSCKSITGTTLEASKGRVQIGLAGDLSATFDSDISDLPATDGLYMQMERGTMYAVAVVAGVEYKSSRVPVLINEGDSLKFSIEYLVKPQTRHIIVKNLQGESIASVSLPLTGMTNNLQLFGRVGHTATFAAATDTPIRVAIEAISLNKTGGENGQ